VFGDLLEIGLFEFIFQHFFPRFFNFYIHLPAFKGMKLLIKFFHTIG
jgi:hypothetical protein